MLDQNFSLRVALVWAAWIAAIVGGILDWTLHIEAAGRSGVVCAGLACTLMVFGDNAKTRRAVRNSLRDADRSAVDLHRVP